MCGKEFQIYGVHIPRKCITHAPLLNRIFPPRSYHHTLGKVKLLIPQGSIFSKKFFYQQQKGVKETMIYFIRIQTDNLKMTWKIRLFIFSMICNFFKWLTVL